MPMTIGARRALVAAAPRTRAELRSWLWHAMEIRAPDRALIPGHHAPMDYLDHAFFERPGPRDCIVWASRGGGKTFYAAIATTLDLVFKPGIEIMILGGSLQQSQRMLAHLRRFFRSPVLAPTVGAAMTDRRLTLRSGSTVEVLAQSHTSVRGARPQKLRCDEADLFHPDVWAAAQLVPRSKECGGTLVRGAIEALSTWHRPTGLMGTLIAEAQAPAAEAPARRLLRWNVVDVVERCPSARECAVCPILEECGGRAKGRRGGSGHVPIDDAIALKRRTDTETWRAEMVCERPVRSGAVYPQFDPAVHVGAFPTPESREGSMVGGIDFGFRDPTVVLWGCVGADATLRIVAEMVTRETTMDTVAGMIREAPWPMPEWFGVDPAGHQRSAVSGVSPIMALRRAGLAMRSRRMPVVEGLRAVRARLAPASGSPTLLIHPRCEALIRSMASYRFPDSAGSSDVPVKDGPDHAADALRYLVTNLPVSPNHGPRAYSYL